MTYDEVGNMTSDGEDYDYEYDAFGRLRKVFKTGTSDLIAEYRYNGLNQRITAHYDTDLDLDVDGSDTVHHFAYDSRWRTVARFEGSDTDPTEQWVHHHAGLVSSGSGSYIDSVILRDRDTTGDGTLDERVYYLQNWRADVVALIEDDGDPIEQARYEPYGTPFGIPAGDVDASGAVDGTDATAVTAWYNAPSYDVRGDLDMDGDIDTTDLALLEDAKDAAATLGLYQLSTVDNRKGYAGYELLSELSETKWDVRNRVLNSELGRWDDRSGAYVRGLQVGGTGPWWEYEPDPGQHACNNNVRPGGACWEDSAYEDALSALMQEISATGCRPPIISCTTGGCPSGPEFQTNGWTRPPRWPSCRPVIGICYRNNTSYAGQCRTLIHELTHALQMCRENPCPRSNNLPDDFFTDPDRCLQHEMEARCRAGQCGGCTPGQTGGYENRDCCRSGCFSCFNLFPGVDSDTQIQNCLDPCANLFPPVIAPRVPVIIGVA